jgi:Ni2+-binding GTPase involved in maturation of urease and hydrogenase
MQIYLVGGFLGSGKTTAIQKACTALMRKGERVGVITNDQGQQLVDSGFMAGFQIPVEEVTNGCFCCNYSDFEKRMSALQEAHQPSIIFAESVGSCTDLAATVANPLQKFHAGIKTVITVFADAAVLPELLKGSRILHQQVSYIYKKQLDEADVLVINKIDLLTGEQLEEVMQLVNTRFAGKIVMYQNSLQQDDIRRWLTILNSFQPPVNRKTLDIDYDEYGAGEAQLAWLDSALEIVSPGNHAVATALDLINKIGYAIKRQQWPVGHMKFFLDDGSQQRKISFTLLNSPVLQEGSGMGARQARLLINARVQTNPAALQKLIRDIIREVAAENGCAIIEGESAAFQPGYPTPEHRITVP